MRETLAILATAFLADGSTLTYRCPCRPCA